MNSTPAKNEKGIALLVVLLIVAIIMVIATEMSGRLQLNVARTINLKANNQAYWYALGAEQFAKTSLSTLTSLTADNINLSQPWAEVFEYPVQGGSIKAELVDMQACFNLNGVNITGSPDAAKDAFNRLLENFIQDSLVSDTIRDSLLDWIDEDTNPSNYGAEDAEYESLTNPYLAANNPLGHTSELRLINGIDQAMEYGGIDELKKVICVLPETTFKVNVNTVTKENAIVLSALLGDTLDSAINIIESRPEEGFKDQATFLALSEVQAMDLSEEQIKWFDVTTKYFKLNTTAKFQGSQFKLSTIFRLDDDSISIISREFGGAF